MRDEYAPETVFDLLSDRSRIQILDALYNQWYQTPETPCLAFSELYTEVDIKDSGQFTYHLNRLSGILIDKRACGYTLTPLGIQCGTLVDQTNGTARTQ